MVIDRGGWSTIRPGHFTPGRETQYPWYMKLGGSQGRPGRVRKISPPPGFDPRTSQHVASANTKYRNIERLVKEYPWAHQSQVQYNERQISTSYIVFTVRSK